MSALTTDTTTATTTPFAAVAHSEAQLILAEQYCDELDAQLKRVQADYDAAREAVYQARARRDACLEEWRFALRQQVDTGA